MTRLPFARVLATALAGGILVTTLTACDPVAWARRVPTATSRVAGSSSPRPVTGSRTPSPTASGAAALCAGDPTALFGVGRRAPAVAYERLPDRSRFTDAVADAGARIVRVGDARLAFDDFGSVTAHAAPKDATLDGGVLGPVARGLIGAGAGRTVLEVAPHTSTRAGSIPTAFPGTNQLDILRVTGAAAVLEGFTVQGTAQGHLYNGLRIDQVHDLRADHLQVVGIPGDDFAPPGETFGINDYKTVGSVWDHIDVDGAGVGASGFGVNGSRDIRICDSSSHGNRYSMGYAFWQSSGIRLVDCAATDNGFSGFNFERVSGTTTLIRPKASGNRYGMRIATDQASGKYVIVDPQLRDGHWTVTLPKRWYGTANRQKRSDVTLIIDGRERPDLLRFQTY